MGQAQERVSGLRRYSRAVVVGLVAIALLSGCKRQREEERVKAVIRKAVEAGNERKADEIMADAVPNFQGPRGMNVDACRRVFVGYFMSEGWIRGFEQGLEIKLIDETHARAELDLVIARGNEVRKLEDVVPTNASQFLFTLELEKIDGDWKFTRGDYREKSL